MRAPSPSPPRPLRLDDSQITTIMTFARPLSSADRDAFVRAVAAVLESQPEVGPGIVGRVCRELQGKFWRPPEVDVRVSKYSRR
jgi:hypothetical protein